MIFRLSISIWILSVHSAAGTIWQSDDPPIVFAGGKITPLSTIPYRDSVALKMTFHVPPRKGFPLIINKNTEAGETIVYYSGVRVIQSGTRTGASSSADPSFMWKQKAQAVIKYISHMCPDYNETDHSHRCFPHLWNLQLHPFPKDSWTFNGDLVLNEKLEVALPQESSTPPLSPGDISMLRNITEMQTMSGLGTASLSDSEILSVMNESVDAATSFLRLQILDHGAMMCAQGHLSRQLVSPDELSAVLLKVKAKLSKQNLEPIVGAGSNTSVYYRIDIKACEFHGNEFSVTLEIPLGQNSTDLTITRLKKLQKLGMYLVEPVPMRLGGDICQIFEKPFLVAIIDRKTTFLPESYCRKDDIFCHLPQVTNLTDYEPCLGPLFPNTQALSHLQTCTPVCHAVKVPFVTLNRPNIAWVATHPEHPLALQCSKSEPKSELLRDIPDVDIGGLEIDLSCGCCDIVYNDTVVMSKFGHGCDDQSFSDCKMFHLVPMQWTIKKEYSMTDLLGPRPCVIPKKTLLTEEGIRRKFFQKEERPTWDRRLSVVLAAILFVLLITFGVWYIFFFRGKRLRDLGPLMTAGFRTGFGHRSDVGIAMRAEEPEVVISAQIGDK